MKRSDGSSHVRVETWLDQFRLDEESGPALPIADDAALELVRRARERCQPAPRATLARLPRWPLIGIGVVVASSAAAAALGELPRWLAWVAPTEARAPDAAATATLKDGPPRGAAAARALPPQPPATDPATASSGATASPALSPAVAEPAPAALGASKPSARQRAPAPPAPGVPRAAALDSPPAADLLGAANRARAERRYATALAIYRDVIDRYPTTRQAQIAAVAAGELELERGDARAAEASFQRVPLDAELGAEALFGLSEAYRAELRVVEERRALDRFVQLYPSNPLAAAARQRLLQLEAAGNSRQP